MPEPAHEGDGSFTELAAPVIQHADAGRAAEQPRRRIRVFGQQQHRSRRGIAGVDPGGGLNDALTVLDDAGDPAGR